MANEGTLADHSLNPKIQQPSRSSETTNKLDNGYLDRFIIFRNSFVGIFRYIPSMNRTPVLYYRDTPFWGGH